VEVTVKNSVNRRLFSKNGDCLQNSSVGKFETSGPQNSKCGKCCQVLATKALSRGFVLCQSTFRLVSISIMSVVCNRCHVVAALRVCTAEVVKEASSHPATRTLRHQSTVPRSASAAKPSSTARQVARLGLHVAV